MAALNKSINTGSALMIQPAQRSFFDGASF
jgi:hypothetical protein